ncbi:MAG: hypothetical protein ABMA64_10585 [Myxococcota bacterium]
MILDLKVERMADPDRRAAAATLRAEWGRAWDQGGWPPMSALPEWLPLRQVNRTLWEVEDALRECERQARFDHQFVELARAVYRANDRRAELKADIDRRLGSALTEPKEHRSAADGAR